MRYAFALVLCILGLPASAGPFHADVVVLGEAHDNPHHHARQAEIVAEIQPAALVFEMLTDPQARAHIPGADEETLAAAFDWSVSGWPAFSMYYPIFAAAPEARVFGAAVTRVAARQAMSDGLAFTFGIGAGAYGLNDPLPPEEQESREALQMSAHCDALPLDVLPAMVDIQRLRDAQLAKMALRAFELTGGPVVVITGNGHARTDWGMPVYLRRAAPEVTIVSLGQGEDAQPPAGTFDVIEDAPSIERPDPCAGFK